MLLNDASIYPSNDILVSILGNSSKIYEAFIRTLPEYHIELEWHYYNDGKTWLGKAVSKKKTIFWVSICEGFFHVSFHFTEKTREGIINLPIEDNIKTAIENQPIKGKLVSLVLDVSESVHLKDITTLILYKQSCK